MRWVLDKIGPQLTAEQQREIDCDRYVQQNKRLLDEPAETFARPRSENEKRSDLRDDLHYSIVAYKSDKADAIRRVIGNPYEA